MTLNIVDELCRKYIYVITINITINIYVNSIHYVYTSHTVLPLVILVIHYSNLPV